MAESVAHQRLKRLAGGWLKSRGFVAVAMEVTLPAGGFRADVAGWTDRRLDRMGLPHRCAPRTAIIECKASRSDFFRDAATAGRLLGRRAAIVAQLGPTARRRRRPTSTPTLFDVRGTTIDVDARRIRGLELELASIDRKLHGRAKFARMARWGVADALWVAAPIGVLSPRDLPAAWGLIECSGASVEVVRMAVGLECSERQRQRLLRDVAVSASRSAFAGVVQGRLPSMG